MPVQFKEWIAALQEDRKRSQSSGDPTYIFSQRGVRRCPTVLQRLVQHAIELHQRMAGIPAQANIVIATLSHIFGKAQVWGLVEDGENPCLSVTRYRYRKRERFLTEAEFARRVRRRIARVFVRWPRGADSVRTAA